MSRKISPAAYALAKPLVDLFVLKGRPLPDEDTLTTWAERLERAALTPEHVRGAVEVMSQDPSKDFSVGDVLAVAGRVKEGERQAAESTRRLVPSESDREIAERVTPIITRTLEFAGNERSPWARRMLWARIRDLAAEMVGHYAASDPKGEAAAEWSKTHEFAEQKISEIPTAGDPAEETDP